MDGWMDEWNGWSTANNERHQNTHTHTDKLNEIGNTNTHRPHQQQHFEATRRMRANQNEKALHV